MAYRVIFDKRALKELQDLTEPWRSRVAEAIHGLAGNPRAQGVIKIRSRADLYRLRVSDYRVVFSIRDDVLLVLIVRVGHRRDIYE